jgi:ferritin-like protein
MGIAWHAPYELLKPETQDMARAIQSLMEELEAVDWYNQRADVSHDDELRRILEHNRDEEKDHACMIIELIRRRDPAFDENLREYLFTTGSITTIEKMVQSSGTPVAANPAVVVPAAPVAEEELPAFTVGSLRPRR